MSELQSTPLLLNAATIAASIFTAVFCVLVMAKTVGPEPEIVIPWAPASKAASFASGNPGMRVDRVGSIISVSYTHLTLPTICSV